MKRRTILVVLTLLFLWVVISRFTELERLKDTFAQARWELVLAALLAQVVYYIVYSATYQAAFATVGIPTRTRDLLPVTLGSLFINVVVPVGGAGGATLFAEELSRKGKPGASAAAGMLLQSIADFTAFTLLLVPGMVYLFIEHDLKAYEIATAAVLLLMTAGLSSILLVGIRKPEWLYCIFGWSRRTANWLFGRLHSSILLADDWAQKNAGEFEQAAAAAAGRLSRLVWTTGIAFLAHLIDVGTLYLLFLAFRQPVSLGVLISGYAMGILFWVVSIAPQGIGVVEGMMALTFTSLGIPGATAATVALAFRGVTFWLPMVVGFFAVQRRRAFSRKHSTLTEAWGMKFAAVLVALMGAINVLSAVTPSLSARLQLLEKFLPLEVQHGGRLTAALAGFALLTLAGGLARRKRTAWLLALGVLVVSALSHLVKGLDYEEALAAGGLIVLLWLMRDHFHARSDRPSVRQGLYVLAGAFLFTLAYGVCGFYLLDRHYSVNFGLWAALRQTVILFTQFYDPGLTPVTRFGRFFADSIYLVGAATFGYAGWMLLRPVFLRDPATPKQRARAKEIVEKYGRSSLARCLLFEDKRYFFSPGGSLVGYALVGREAVALGDPVGPESDRLPAILAYREICQENDWLPVFYQTPPETLDLYREAGFDAVRVGEEGIVNLQTFTLEGSRNKPLRKPVNKLAEDGYRFELYQPPIPDGLLAELRAISDEWLTTMHGSEKRFSLGWFDDAYIRSSPIAVVCTPGGWISAFANLVPEYQINEITIDLMRHRKEIENGTMEFLFVSLFQWAKGQGYQGFNLGLSALAGVGEQAGDAAIEHVLHWIYEHVDQFYNFKGLHRFKEKFHPAWSPRYLIYPGAANLGRSWLAVVQANSGRRSPESGAPRKRGRPKEETKLKYSLDDLKQTRYINNRTLDL